jgi:CDP-diacylglycerol--glycerol-3-phosphate 3-phosphatidyltransferase
MARGRLNLPNVITLGRILACPAVFFLVLTPSVTPRLFAFVLFLAAAISDLWDGYLARKHGLITDLGKLLDPLADKLLLVATFVPFYILSHGGTPVGPLPFLGPLPLWVVVIIFGREVFITAFRSFAAGKGVVISAGKSGKYKAFFQVLFIGGLLLWYPLEMLSLERGWGGGFWTFWTYLHGGWIVVMLSAALILTVFSMGDYLWGYRRLLGAGR